MVLRMLKHLFGLPILIAGWSMRIDVNINYEKSLIAPPNRCAHCQSWSPGTIMPREIDSPDLFEENATQEGYASVARIMQSDLFFKIQPPFALLRRNTTWNSNSRMNVWHIH